MKISMSRIAATATSLVCVDALNATLLFGHVPRPLKCGVAFTL
jgi:hypothetical protein